MGFQCSKISFGKTFTTKGVISHFPIFQPMLLIWLIVLVLRVGILLEAISLQSFHNDFKPQEGLNTKAHPVLSQQCWV